MRNIVTLPILLIAGAALVGCASSAKNPLLDEARLSYSQAQNDPQVVKRAAGELQEAGDALAKANRALDKGEEKEEVNHLAYLAKQRVAIATEVANRKKAEEAVELAEAERAKVQLDVRTAEADAARIRAKEAEANAKMTAEQLQQQQAAAEAAAEVARREAELAQQSSSQTSAELEEARAKLQQMQDELAGMNAKQTERGIVVTLGDVLFDTGKADLKPGAARNLEKVAQFLQEYPERVVMIEGFTDSTGSDSFNLQLSEQRAVSVRTALRGLGVPADRIQTRGYGEEYPVASNSMAAGRQLNRRVEIVFSDEQGNVTARAPAGHGNSNSDTASGPQGSTPARGGTRTEESTSTGVNKGAPQQQQDQQAPAQ